jgi:processing peptidase subunit beta
MIVKYHRDNYFGSNFIVVGGGGVNHQELCDQVEKHFSRVKARAPSPPTPKPKFKDEVFLMESELTPDLNISIFYEAPEWNHPHYYDFLILQRLLADRPENIMEA